MRSGFCAGKSSRSPSVASGLAPVYRPGTDTLLHYDDFTSYTTITAMGANPQGSTRRFCPKNSPVVTGGAVDPSENDLGSGGPTGQFFRLKYTGNNGESPALWLLNYPTVDPLSHCCISWLGRFTPSASMDNIVFACKFQEHGYTSSNRRQWSTHDALPWQKGANPDHDTYWQTLNQSGFGDEASAFPNGHDLATQPVGPYFNDLCDGTTWWRFTMQARDHTSSGNKDGYSKMHVNDTKIMHQSVATVGVVPPGGEKQWCGIDSANNIYVDGNGQDLLEFRIGDVSTSADGIPSINFDITDFYMWLRPTE